MQFRTKKVKKVCKVKSGQGNQGASYTRLKNASKIAKYSSSADRVPKFCDKHRNAVPFYSTVRQSDQHILYPMLRRIAHAPEGETTKLVPEISASERLTQLLDYDKKGFISKEDIYNTCFAVVLDLSVSDMKAITDVEPKRHAEMFMGVLMDYNLPIGEVEELVDYFTRTRLQRRPDKFKHLPRSEYFIKRFIELYTPIAALFIDKFIPNVTPDEQSVYNITRNVLSGFDQFALALIYTSLILTVTSISNISPLTVIAVLSVSLPVGWGSHSARESYYLSSEGTVLKNAWQRRLMIRAIQPFISSLAPSSMD